MPRLPTYTAEVRQHGIPSGRRATTGDFFNASVQRASGAGARFAASAVSRAAQLASRDPVAEATENLGETFQQVSEQYVQIRERRDVANQQILSAQARDAAYQRMDQLKAEGEPGIAEKMDEFLQEQAETLRNNAETRAGMEAAERGVAALHIDVGHSSRIAEAQIAGAKAKEGSETLIAAHGRVLDSDPELLPRLIDEYTVWASNLGIPEAARDELIREGHERLTLTAANRWIRYDAQLGKKMVEEGRFDPWITADRKNDLIDYADRAIRAEEADARRAREQAEKQAAVTRERLAVESALAISDPENDPLVELDKVRELAGKVGPDGLPLVSFTRLQQLETMVDQAIAGEEVKTPDPLSQQLATEMAQTGAPTKNTVLDNIHRMSDSDRKFWTQRIGEANTQLREYRNINLDSFLGSAGLQKKHLWLAPGASRVYTQAAETFVMREEQYRENNVDPAMYYQGGATGLPSIDDDVARLRPALERAWGTAETGMEVITTSQVGDVFEDPTEPGRFYLRTGRDPNNLVREDHLVEVEAENIDEAREKAAGALKPLSAVEGGETSPEDRPAQAAPRPPVSLMDKLRREGAAKLSSAEKLDVLGWAQDWWAKQQPAIEKENIEGVPSRQEAFQKGLQGFSE